MHSRPPDDVILERAKSFCNRECFTVALQHRRLQTQEPEDEIFLFRWHADLQFLIIALRRLRRAAELAARVPQVSDALKAAIEEFDKALPGLAKMRNVGEHIDDYLLGTGRLKEVRKGALQVSTWDGTVFNWLDVELNIDIALEAAQTLFAVLGQSVKQYVSLNVSHARGLTPNAG
jgi:hypothetical protein